MISMPIPLLSACPKPVLLSKFTSILTFLIERVFPQPIGSTPQSYSSSHDYNSFISLTHVLVLVVAVSPVMS